MFNLDTDLLQPENVIPQALKIGLVTNQDIVWGEVALYQMGRSHAVYRLDVNGSPRWVIKSFGPRRGDTDGCWKSELAVLKLAADLPGLASLVPTWQDWPGATGIVATAFVPGLVAWGLDEWGEGQAQPMMAWEGLVRIIAPALAKLHRATRPLAKANSTQAQPFSKPVPWALRLFDGDGPTDVWQNPVLAKLLQQWIAQPGLVSAVRRARGAWRSRCLIHGDLKHDNVLVQTDSGGSPERVTIIDWEMAAIGDPAWDLAGLIVRLLLAMNLTTAWEGEPLAAIAKLIQTYAEPAQLPVAALAQRCVFYGGVWALMSGIQHAAVQPPDTTTDATDHSEAAFGVAAFTLLQVDRLTQTLLNQLTDRYDQG